MYVRTEVPLHITDLYFLSQSVVKFLRLSFYDSFCTPWELLTFHILGRRERSTSACCQGNMAYSLCLPALRAVKPPEQYGKMEGSFQFPWQQATTYHPPLTPSFRRRTVMRTSFTFTYITMWSSQTGCMAPPCSLWASWLAGQDLCKKNWPLEQWL